MDFIHCKGSFGGRMGRMRDGADVANEIQNEQAKLRATFCNGLALSVLTVGVLIPVVSSMYKWFQSIDAENAIADVSEITFIWLVAAIFLHVVATLLLEGMVENE